MITQKHNTENDDGNMIISSERTNRRWMEYLKGLLKVETDDGGDTADGGKERRGGGC